MGLSPVVVLLLVVALVLVLVLVLFLRWLLFFAWARNCRDGTPPPPRPRPVKERPGFLPSSQQHLGFGALIGQSCPPPLLQSPPNEGQ